MQENTAVQFRTWGRDNIAYGPVELPGLVNWIREGRVRPDSWVFRDDKLEWVRAQSISEVKLFFKGKPAGDAASQPAEGITPGSLRRIKVLADVEERLLGSLLQYLVRLR